MAVSDTEFKQLEDSFVALKERMDSIGSRLIGSEDISAQHGERHNDLGEDPIIGAQLSGHTHGQETFPQVEATAISNDSATSSHTVSIPADSLSGELLLVFFSPQTDPDGVTWPAGWTQYLIDENRTPFLYGAYRFADGTDGSSITVITGQNETTNHNAYRISRANLQAPAVATADGSTTTPDPPSLSPSGGKNRYLWIAAAADGNLLTAGPNNYEDYISNRVGSAWRQIDTATEDPGTFTLSSDTSWTTATVAVYPTTTVEFGMAGLRDNAGTAVVPAADNRISITDDGVVNADKSGNTIALSIVEDAFRLGVTEKTANYTAATTDTVILCDATAGAFTITLPTAVGNTGKVFEIKKIDAANDVTVDGDGTETIDDGTTAVLTVQYEAITIVSDGDEWFIL